MQSAQRGWMRRAWIRNSVALVAVSLGFAAPAAATNVGAILECVVAQSNGYVAWFGYESTASAAVDIPIGSNNRIRPSPRDRGQPTTFFPGRHSYVFSVPFAAGESIIWKLPTQSATAGANSLRCTTLDLQPETLPSGELGVPYEAQLEAIGGVGPKSFSVTGLPPGLSVDANGLISGTPQADGTFPVQASVQDQIGQVASRDYSLVVFTDVIGCNGDPLKPELVVGGDGNPLAVLNRLPSECEPVGVLLRTDSSGEAQTADLEKPPGNEPATLDLTWEPEPAVLPLPVTEIDFDGPQGNPAEPVQFCDGTFLAPIALDGVAWCLVSQTTTLVGEQQVVVTERYFGLGDPRWSR